MNDLQFDERFSRYAARHTKGLAEGIAYILAATIARLDEGNRIMDALRALPNDPDLKDRPVATLLLTEVLRYFDAAGHLH